MSIKIGESAIIKLPSGNFKIIQIQKGHIDLGKFGSFECSELVNFHYGTPIEITDNGLIKCNQKDYLMEQFQIDLKLNNENTNQEFSDLKNQLSQKEIEDLKSKNIDPKLIIKQLVENNENFEKKTEYSKAKYVNKKMKKFSRVFVPLECNSQNLLMYYQDRAPEKIRELRIDTLSQILTLANLRVGSRALVCDDTGGMMGLAILERTSTMDERQIPSERAKAAKAAIVKEESVVEDSVKDSDMQLETGAEDSVEDSDMKVESDEIDVRQKNVSDIYFIHDGKSPGIEIVKFSPYTNYHTYPWYRFHTPLVDQQVFYINEITTDDQFAIDRKTIRMKKLKMEDETVKKGDFDCLIIGSKFEPLEIIKKLNPLLMSSAQIVCYAPRKEMLLKAYNHIRLDPGFVNSQLTESFMREYQVPVHASGTHPEMMTSGTGGFLFHATKVDDDNVVIVKQTYKQQRAGGKIKKQKRDRDA
jgi:tRNA (adenine-N(1)-)-methyltransferase non-catalytic subunit